MGSRPPDLEVLEVGELTADELRGIFKLTYAGDAHLVVQTRVQVNPLWGLGASPAASAAGGVGGIGGGVGGDLGFGSGIGGFGDIGGSAAPGVVAADRPLVVPMMLKLCELRLRGIVVLVVSESRGVTLEFKNEPLEHVRVSSSFDDVPAVARFLQKEIQEQLCALFRYDLPQIIHEMSMAYIATKSQEQQQQQRHSADDSPHSEPDYLGAGARTAPEARTPYSHIERQQQQHSESVVISPAVSTNAAHLASLIQAGHSLAGPFTQPFEHLVLRSLVTTPQRTVSSDTHALLPSQLDAHFQQFQQQQQQPRRAVQRRVHHLQGLNFL
ncbi:hypothetical protein GQ42DRAFT_162123 [Ramicandelaber brevisporus]|nr:hypothetical protein GQ42DRAFT_162123 [Ramicandelaber brevisporus]